MSQLTKPKFELGEGVMYHGKTYSFVGYISAITDDGQYVVTAYTPNAKFFIGMKHIYGESQLVSNPWSSKPDTSKIFDSRPNLDS